MNLLHATVLLTLALAATSAVAQPETHTVARTIGDASIVFPIPDGFSDAETRHPPSRAHAEEQAPPPNRVVAVFVDDEYLAELEAGREATMTRSFSVQTARAMEDQDLTMSDFQAMRLRARNRTEQDLREHFPDVQPHLDGTVSPKDMNLLELPVGEARVIEILDDRPNSLTTLTAVSYEFQSIQGAALEMLLLIQSTSLINGKVVYFFGDTNWRSDSDFDWIRQQARQWASRLNALNGEDK